MKFLLVCSVCLALSSADVQEILQPNSTVINNSEADSAEKNTFKVFSLNSYDHQNPLIIQSNIPEELKPLKGDIKNGDNSSPKNIDLPAPRLGELTLPLPYSHKPFSPVVPSYAFESGLPNVEVVPTLKIDSLSDLSPLLTSERPFAVGVSFDSAIPQYPPLTGYTGVSSQSFYPASPLPYSHVFELLPNLHSHAHGESHNYFDYIIQKVPEVVSFSKPGIFTEADIPTITEFEAIFNKSVSSDFQPTVIDARFGGRENSLVASSATPVDEVGNTTPLPVTLSTKSVSNANGSIWDFVNANTPQTSGVESEDLTTVVAETGDADSTLVSQNVLDAVFHGDTDLKVQPVDGKPLTFADTTAITEEPEATTLAL
ncbi:uncharacterized protein [Euwallacea similis]|uniref:uncharacterized protein n=1 Tax=Euwallacea similis TaxID=1736056 RepID=UPI00344E2E22